jgi:Leucine-rich repeat (LRR) protein
VSSGSRLFEPEDLSGLVCLKSLNIDETDIAQLLPKSWKDVFFGGRKSWGSHFHCHLLQKESLDPNTHSILNSLSDLSSLISLDLSYCNLSDGAIPNDLGYLSSLEILSLSGNKFGRIPDTICQLSNLESLYLSNCNRLQALPKLPLSLTYLCVENCPKLEESSDLLFTGTLSEKLALADCSLAALYIDYDGGSPCSILQLDLRKHLEKESHWVSLFLSLLHKSPSILKYEMEVGLGMGTRHFFSLLMNESNATTY